MPINFPSNPSLNQTYTNNSVTWQWNGTVWNIVSNASPTFTTVTATNVVTTNLSTTNATITNITGNTNAASAPTQDTHITNKKYVDTRSIAMTIGLS
jgi:hypothetical protein